VGGVGPWWGSFEQSRCHPLLSGVSVSVGHSVSSAKVHDRSINYQIEGLFGHEWPRLEPGQDTASVIRHPPSAIRHFLAALETPSLRHRCNVPLFQRNQRTSDGKCRRQTQSVTLRQSESQERQGFALMITLPQKKHKRTALVCRPLPAGNLASGQQEKHNRPLCQLVG
jgi:hypothetical protein